MILATRIIASSVARLARGLEWMLFNCPLADILRRSGLRQMQELLAQKQILISVHDDSLQ